MSSSAELIKPPSEEYDDEVLYGQRLEAARAEALLNVDKHSECVMHSVGTAYVHKEHWTIKNVTGNDIRLKRMMETLQITHALPLQRYSWPQIERAQFPLLSISPEATGKTMAHLLYAITRCITSVPITKTNQMLSLNDTLGTFKTTNSTSTCKQLPSNLDNIDQENFDFDSMGAVPERQILQPSNNSDGLNGHYDQTKEKNDAWGGGPNTGEHFEVDIDEFIFHPKYIIVSSNQHQVEFMDREVSRMKLAAFGDDKITNMKLRDLPPRVKTLNIHQDDDKLALKCNEAEILIATPGPLIKCFELGYLNFVKCKKIFFDDLDLTLQLYNFKVKKLIKRYFVETELEDSTVENVDPNQIQDTTRNCQLYFFSRKWTDLVKQFLQAVFPQIIIMFGSIAEAALYANMRYDLEICSDTPNSKLAKLINLINFTVNDPSKDNRIAVVCRHNAEAERVSQAIANQGHVVKFLPEETPIIALRSKTATINGFRSQIKPIYVMGDVALDLVCQDLTDASCIIHFSMPQSLLTFDQRFRIMYANIKEAGRKQISATIFVDSQFNPKHAKELYDIISRSSTTLKSTKLELRDLISDTSNKICWRWAATGLCRLEKLSREDRFGTYCADKHSLSQIKPGHKSKWPAGGQFKITITHLVSPNEFYFWFEAHRDRDSKRGKWIKFESTGSEFLRDLQKKLDRSKPTDNISIPVDRFKKGVIYGVYLSQEARVYRVRLMEDVVFDKSLSKLSRFGYHFTQQCEVLKIDYGARMHVYLKNLFYLPDSLAIIEPQCHRGFHLGVKPCDNEPDWLFKAKQRFYDLICVKNLVEITVWLRLNSNNCFWFEKMKIAQKLESMDDKRLYTSEPHQELIEAQLAAESTTEPSCLNPSERLMTLSKWHVEKSNDFVQTAFLRRDKAIQDIYILHTLHNLDLHVRLYEYNKQLLELEWTMLKDFIDGKLRALNYFRPGVYCLAKIFAGTDPASKQPTYTINRALIWNLGVDTKEHDEPKELNEGKLEVECLDHGDLFCVNRANLYEAAPEYLSILPFQAIKGQKLFNLNEEILNDSDLCRKVMTYMYDHSRDNNNEMIKLSCLVKDNGELQIFIPRRGVSVDSDEPVERLFKRLYDIDLVK